MAKNSMSIPAIRRKAALRSRILDARVKIAETRDKLAAARSELAAMSPRKPKE